MVFSFRTKLLIVFTLVLGITISSTFYLVLRSTYASIENNAENELNVALAVFQELLDERGSKLRDSNLILTKDFALMDAIATNEDETIISVLANHGDRINADLIILLDREGNTVFSTHDNVLGENFLQHLTQDPEQGVSVLTLAEDQPYQLVLAPVRAPDEIIAWVGMGFTINRDLMNNLKQITGTDISFIYQSPNEHQPRLLSTSSFLASDTLSEIEVTLDSELKDFERQEYEQQDSRGTLQTFTEHINSLLTDNEHLTAVHTIMENDRGILSVLLSTSLEQEFEPYQDLQIQMMAIFAVALILALITTYFFARSITQPIQSLVNVARGIAKGNYRQAIRLRGNNELNLLGQTLNIMQGAINQREEHIIYQAQHDLLTRLPNSEFARELIEDRIHGDYEFDNFTFSILQIRNLNQLNDVYGTAVKDQLLGLVAKRLRSLVDPKNLVARINNNEFLIFETRGERDTAQSRCKHLISRIEGSYRCGSIDIHAVCKIGIALCPEHGANYDDLLRRAHIALSRCKASSLRYGVYQEGEDENHLRKINITSRLQYAIRHKGFELVFQPQFDLRKQNIQQCEVLLRWQDSELGPISPEEFIPLAEHSGDITHITRFVFNQSLRQLQQWQQNGIAMGLCINLSTKDILSTEFINYILRATEKIQYDKKLLVLEITETAMLESPEKAIDNLQKLYDAGLQISMDDFGTGFSSLSQLKTIPLHEIKIDKSFIKDIHQDVDDQKIVKATIEMAHNLNLTVVAEGVENKAAFNLLKSMQCDIIQGFYLTEPLIYEDLENWLDSGKFAPLKAAF